MSNNTTDQVDLSTTWLWYAALICTITLTFLSLLGILGNLLSIVVFSHSHFRRLSINLLLIALSAADMTLVILAIPVFSLAPFMTIAAHWSSLAFISNVYTFSVAYLYPIVQMAQCTSVWLLIAVTVERWAAVCRPLLVSEYFTRKRAVMTIGIIVTLAMSYNFISFWEFRIEKPYELAAVLRENNDYRIWKMTVAYFATTFLIPLSLLIFLNGLVAKEIFRSQSVRKEMTTAQRGDQRTARMLIYVVLMFICCYSLSFILNVWEALYPAWFQSPMGYVLSDINNILAVINSATTWLFYLKFSTRYQKTVIQLWRKVTCREDLYEMRDRRISIYSMISRAPSICGSIVGHDAMLDGESVLSKMSVGHQQRPRALSTPFLSPLDVSHTRAILPDNSGSKKPKKSKKVLVRTISGGPTVGRRFSESLTTHLALLTKKGNSKPRIPVIQISVAEVLSDEECDV